MGEAEALPGAALASVAEAEAVGPTELAVAAVAASTEAAASEAVAAAEEAERLPAQRPQQARTSWHHTSVQ